MNIFFWSDIIVHVRDGWSLAGLVVLVGGACLLRLITLKFGRH
jgi:hypothetical protein